MNKKTEEIIDGIDVSGCLYFLTNGFEVIERPIPIDDFCSKWKNSCSANNNCYYKQLQRANAEIEELKAGRRMLTVKYTDRYSEIKKLTAENERLKVCINRIKDLCTHCTNEKFTLKDFLQAKDNELTETGQVQRDILKIISEVENG